MKTPPLAAYAHLYLRPVVLAYLALVVAVVGVLVSQVPALAGVVQVERYRGVFDEGSLIGLPVHLFASFVFCTSVWFFEFSVRLRVRDRICLYLVPRSKFDWFMSCARLFSYSLGFVVFLVIAGFPATTFPLLLAGVFSVVEGCFWRARAKGFRADESGVFALGQFVIVVLAYPGLADFSAYSPFLAGVSGAILALAFPLLAGRSCAESWRFGAGTRTRRFRRRRRRKRRSAARAAKGRVKFMGSSAEDLLEEFPVAGSSRQVALNVVSTILNVPTGRHPFWLSTIRSRFGAVCALAVGLAVVVEVLGGFSGGVSWHLVLYILLFEYLFEVVSHTEGFPFLPAVLGRRATAQTVSKASTVIGTVLALVAVLIGGGVTGVLWLVSPGSVSASSTAALATYCIFLFAGLPLVLAVCLSKKYPPLDPGKLVAQWLFLLAFFVLAGSFFAQGFSEALSERLENGGWPAAAGLLAAVWLGLALFWVFCRWFQNWFLRLYYERANLLRR